MNRLLLWIVLLIFGCMATAAQGQTTSCVKKQRCPEGVSPPACCQAPPCEFYEQIRTKTAVQNLFANKETRERLKKKAGGDNKKAARLLYEFVVNKAKNMGKTLRCPWQSIQFPPSFETNPECQITAVLGTGPEPMSKETALNRFNTCSEFIEAAYSHEQFHKDICFKTNSVERENQGLEDYAKEEIAGYQKEIDALKADLQDFWNACSPVGDAETARKLAQQGISVLKKKAAKSRS